MGQGAPDGRRRPGKAERMDASVPVGFPCGSLDEPSPCSRSRTMGPSGFTRSGTSRCILRPHSPIIPQTRWLASTSAIPSEGLDDLHGTGPRPVARPSPHGLQERIQGLPDEHGNTHAPRSPSPTSAARTIRPGRVSSARGHRRRRGSCRRTAWQIPRVGSCASPRDAHPGRLERIGQPRHPAAMPDAPAGYAGHPLAGPAHRRRGPVETLWTVRADAPRDLPVPPDGRADLIVRSRVGVRGACDDAVPLPAALQASLTKRLPCPKTPLPAFACGPRDAAG